jgi:hypothetical protein
MLQIIQAKKRADALAKRQAIEDSTKAAVQSKAETGLTAMQGGRGTAQDTTNVIMAGKRLPPVAKPEKPYDPSTAIQDSSASALLNGDMERYYSLNPGKRPKPKEYDASAALADSVAARALRGDVEGAQKLKAAVSSPKSTAGEYTESQARTAQNEMARIVANYSKGGIVNMDKATPEEIAAYNMNQNVVKSYAEKKNLDAFTKANPPAKYKDKYGKDDVTGQLYQSDGKDWIPIQRKK